MRDVKRASKAMLYGGLTAGTVDIGAACLINRRGPVFILHAIASGVLGPASFAGGAPSAALGLCLQWGMSLAIAVVFVIAARLYPRLLRRWIGTGVLYGFVIFFVMNYLVLPLSAAAPPHYFTVGHLMHRFTVEAFFANLAAMLVFGLIVSWFAQRFLARPAAGNTPATG